VRRRPLVCVQAMHSSVVYVWRTAGCSPCMHSCAPLSPLLPVYCIDGRGRKWLEPAGLVPALQAASVSTVNLTVNRVTITGKVRHHCLLGVALRPIQ